MIAIVATIILTLLLIFICNLNENFTFSDIKKINLIDKIVWINLNRSVNRRAYMEDMLNKLNVKNERISGIDGKFVDVEKLVKNIKRREGLSLSEIACTLSHIKAINSLKNQEGKYFMVCEDDITLDNLQYFKNIDLKKIIEKCPDFDILILHKFSNFQKNLDQDYTLWNKRIYSTACYIVSKNGVNKLINNCEYVNDLNFKFKNDEEFNVADYYLYNLMNTWVYKYNIINTKDEDSTIHDSHLKFQKNSNKFNLDLILKNVNL